jgi:hypothetical protein
MSFMRDSDKDGKQDVGLKRAKQIFLYSDSEPNEVLIGLLHAIILPFAMFEMGDPSLIFQLVASATGWFQLYSVLYNGTLRIRKIAVQLATLVAIATCVNYYMLDMLNGSHFGWLLILIFAVWNLVRVTRESLYKN